MDVEKLASEIGELRYKAEHHFEFGQPFYETLSEGDLRGVLVALETRGFTLVCTQQPNMESPSICNEGRHNTKQYKGHPRIFGQRMVKISGPSKLPGNAESLHEADDNGRR
jgi:hypothetical protein